MDRIVRDLGERAFRFAFRLSGNTADARDLVQEAFRRFFDRGDRFDPKQGADRWLFSILRNVFLDARRRSGNQLSSLDILVRTSEGVDEYLADLLPDEEEGLLERLERLETAEEVRRAIGRLSVEFRTALVLCDMDAMTYNEIAEIMDCPVNTVRSRIKRARLALKRELTAS